MIVVDNYVRILKAASSASF